MNSLSSAILFVVYEAGHAVTAIELLSRIKDNLSARPIIVCPYHLPDNSMYEDKCIDLGIKYFSFRKADGQLKDIKSEFFEMLTPKNEVTKSTSMESIPLLKQLKINFSLKYLFDDNEVNHFKIESQVLREQIELFSEILAKTQVSAVFMFEDNVERDSGSWIKAGKHTGTPISVYSFGQVAENEFAETYFNYENHRFTSLKMKIFTKLFPHWFIHYKGVSLGRLPAYRVLSQEATGIAPRNPKIVNSGDLSQLLVESPYIVNEYRKYRGTKDIPFKVTGNFLFDDIFEKMKVSRKKLEKTIVVALPPNMTHLKGSSYFENYQQLLDFWMKSARALKNFQRILYCPHPNLDLNEFQFELNPNEELKLCPVANIMTEADLYIASVSSTIKWARALDIPVIDFDVYSYNYKYYLNQEGIFSVQQPKDFTDLIEKDNAENIFFNLNSPKGYWGQIDGKSAQRITETINSLMERPSINSL